jgi:hypothetical protein
VFVEQRSGVRGGAADACSLRGYHMKKTFLLAALFSLTISFGSVTASLADDKPVFLGVIERTPSKYEAGAGTTPYMVRAAFRWKKNDWKSMPGEPGSLAEFPERVVWTIAFDGRNLGQIHTTRPPSWEYGAYIGLLQPDPSDKFKPLPSPPGEFLYGFDGGGYDRLVVAVSKPNFTDPDHWKPAGVQQEVVRSLIPFFRKEVASIPGSSVDESTENPHGPYSDSLIQVRKSYASADGARLVQLALPDSAALQCDPTEDWASPHWFYVKGKTIRFLGASLEMIDAGDYDGDGHSEVIFHQCGYNYDGFILFYDGFRKRAEFGWTYH